jgi:hypothetical protein
MSSDNAEIAHWQAEIDSTRRDIRQMIGKPKWLAAWGGAALCLLVGFLFIKGLTSSSSSAAPSPAVNQPQPLPPATLPAFQSTFPVLSVIEQDGQSEGRWQHISLRFERSEDRKAPLRIAVGEDTAVGAGSTLRASLWQAAIVAALLRNDTLQGVQATFTLTGATDGTSAGGVCCLALLSALDQRPLPTDFAFTGSILPDGTIGRVGGLPQKIAAAKQAGVQRVLVPEYCRYELDRASGQSIDIKQRCVELGLEYLPVTSIEQAYALVHHLPSPASDVTDKHLAAFSEQEEAILLAEVRRLTQKADERAAALTDAEKATLEVFIAETMKTRRAIDHALIAGQIAVAYRAALNWSVIQAFLERVKQQDFHETDSQALLRRLEEEVESSRQQIPLASELASQLHHGPSMPLGVQLLLPCTFRPGVTCRLRYLHNDLDAHRQELANAPQQSLPEGKSRVSLVFETTAEAKLLWSLACESACFEIGQRLELANALKDAWPGVPAVPSERVQATELLFEQALDASQKTFFESVLTPNSAGSDPDEIFVLLEHTDPLVLELEIAYEDAVHLREAIKGQSTAKSDALLLLSAQCQLKAMVYFWAATVRWAELEPMLDDDKTVADHGQRELLNQLIERARNKALANIIACRRQGIPCPGVVAAYQQALSLDADRQTDGVEVLASYWLTSLEGQLLTLIHTAN